MSSKPTFIRRRSGTILRQQRVKRASRPEDPAATPRRARPTGPLGDFLRTTPVERSRHLPVRGGCVVPPGHADMRTSGWPRHSGRITGDGRYRRADDAADSGFPGADPGAHAPQPRLPHWARSPPRPRRAWCGCSALAGTRKPATCSRSSLTCRSVKACTSRCGPYAERRRTGHEIEEPVLRRAGRDEPVDVRRAAILQEVPVQIGLREANQRFSKAVMAGGVVWVG